jgi:hypothetical protein
MTILAMVILLTFGSTGGEPVTVISQPSITAANGTITLDFNSLPSAQGWTYVTGNSGILETNVFSVDGSMLHMDTMSVGFTGLGYKLFNVVDPQLPFTLSVRARVTAYVVQSPGNPYGFDLSVLTGSEQFEIGISPNRIMGGAGDQLFSTTIDVTQFHDYRIEGTPGGSFELFVDNVSLGTAFPRPINQPGELFFGDGTAGANARVDIANYSFVQFIAVQIDIKPGSFPNNINPGNNGVIPVAILTTGAFDATTVDPMSVRFGPNGAVEAHGRGHIEDADGDGDLDLVLHFRTQSAGITCGATSASLTGMTFYGQTIQGTDSVRTVGCN